MWQSDAIEEGGGERETRFINISDIKDIRLGTDIDPITSDSALQSAYEHGEIQRSDMDMVKEARQREGINNIPTDKSFYARKTGGFLSSFFVSKEKDVVLYGTPTLRRSCKEEDMKMCISLILEDRTFDIQCLQQRDMDTLRINLNELIHIHDTKTLGGKSPSMYLAANDNPLKAQKVTPKKTTPKKSVRFSTDPDDSKRDNMTASQLPHLELGSLGSESTGLSRQGSAVMYWNEDEEDLDKLLDKTISPLNSPMASDGTVSPVPDHVSNREPTETNKPSLRMTSTEALQIGFILSEQEKLYGTNMYESLQAADEVEIAKYVAKGFTSEEAIMRIFEKKYVPSNRMKLAYMSRTASEMANLLNPSKVGDWYHCIRYFLILIFDI